MKTYRNASERTIKAGEIIYVDGDNIYPHNPSAPPQLYGAIIRKDVESGALIVEDDLIRQGALTLFPPPDSTIYME